MKINRYIKVLCLSIAGMLTITSLSFNTPVTVRAGSTLVKSIQTASNMTLEKGTKTQLCVSVSPVTAVNKSVTFSSSDKTIITVSKTGIIKAKQNGQAMITVASNDGNKRKKIAVTVQNTVKPVLSINPRIRSRFMTIGDQFQIVSNVLPATASNKNIYYTTSDPGVVTVSKKGVIKAINKGKAVIYVHSSDSRAASVHFRIEVSNSTAKHSAKVLHP